MEVSELKPPLPPRPENPSEPTYWRDYSLDLKTKDWNSQTVKSLHDDVVKLAGIKSEIDIFSRDPKLQIIFVGHTGSGKSSLINSLVAALTGFISNVVVEGCRDHTSVAFNEIPAHLKDDIYLDLAFYDLRGTGAASAGSREVDVLRGILMRKKNGEKFVPGQKDCLIDENVAHVILYVMDGAAFVQKIEKGEDDQWLPVILDLKDITEKCVSKYLVATHMDMLDPELKKNVKAMHTSNKVKIAVEKIKEKTKFPKKNILPVLNPVDATHKMEDQYRVYFLYQLWQIVQDANLAHKQRMYTQRRIQQQQQQLEPQQQQLEQQQQQQQLEQKQQQQQLGQQQQQQLEQQQQQLERQQHQLERQQQQLEQQQQQLERQQKQLEQQQQQLKQQQQQQERQQQQLEQQQQQLKQQQQQLEQQQQQLKQQQQQLEQQQQQLEQQQQRQQLEQQQQQLEQQQQVC